MSFKIFSNVQKQGGVIQPLSHILADTDGLNKLSSFGPVESLSRICIDRLATFSKAQEVSALKGVHPGEFTATQHDALPTDVSSAKA
jgi:hypothetical protein